MKHENENILDFLNSRNDATNILTEIYKVSVKQKDDLYLLKYNQIDTPKCWLTDQCRGSIFYKDYNGKYQYACRPFNRFYNYGEGRASKIDWDSANVLSKEDGCCHEDTIIKTPIGDKRIKDICESNYKGLVLAYSLECNSFIWTPILETSISEEINDWYEVKLYNGQNIILTGNHRVWVENLKCWRRVEDIEIDDDLIVY